MFPVAETNECFHLQRSEWRVSGHERVTGTSGQQVVQTLIPL